MLGQRLAALPRFTPDITRHAVKFIGLASMDLRNS